MSSLPPARSNKPNSTRGWTDPKEFVEISGHTLAVVHGGDFGTAQQWHIGMPRVGRHGHFAAPEKGERTKSAGGERSARMISSLRVIFTRGSKFVQPFERDPSMRHNRRMRGVASIF